MTPTSDPSMVNIPKCCIEGSDDCPHVLNKDVRSKKRNIGM